MQYYESIRNIFTTSLNERLVPRRHGYENRGVPTAECVRRPEELLQAVQAAAVPAAGPGAAEARLRQPPLLLRREPANLQEHLQVPGQRGLPQSAAEQRRAGEVGRLDPRSGAEPGVGVRVLRGAAELRLFRGQSDPI